MSIIRRIIHVIYGEYVGIIDIQTLELIEGDLPEKPLSMVMVKEWTDKHKADLLTIWNTQRFVRLPPLE
jgi:hypothetical protein